MSFQFRRHAVEEDDDWVIVTPDWWRTLFSSISWSYGAQQDPGDKKTGRRQFRGPLVPDSTSRRSTPSFLLSRRGSASRERNDGECTLNPDLVGVKGAMEAVIAYERDVGFDYVAFPNIEPHELNPNARVDLSPSIDEEELVARKERWNELLDGLMNGPVSETNDSDESLESSLMDSQWSLGDLRRCSSTLSSIDLTSSEGSIDSIGMPSTPKARSSFNDVEVKDLSPTSSVSGGYFHSVSPGRSLNASASSFVPNFYSHLNDEPLHFASLRDIAKSLPKAFSPSPSFAHFTFPTLNVSPAPAVKIKKDDQGFVTEVQIENTAFAGSATGLLPPFLQESSQRSRARKSRTREIVDRLRSQVTPDEGSSVSPKFASHSPSPICEDMGFVQPRRSVSEDGGERPSGLSTPSCEDDDGWIDVTHPTAVPSPNEKAQRTRELFRALTRRRTDSLSSENLIELMASSENLTGTSRYVSSSSPSPSRHTPAPAPVTVTSNDGWIESTTAPPVEPAPPNQKNHKSRSKTPSGSKESHHGRKKSSNHNRNHNHASRASTSSGSQFSATPASSPSSSCYPPPSHPSTGPTPQMVPSPAAMPFFFPAYPAVAMPVPYAAFMHIPSYPLGMATHGYGHLVGQPTGVQYVPTALPTFMPLTPSSMTMSPHTTTTTTSTNMNMSPAYRTAAKHSPLW